MNGYAAWGWALTALAYLVATFVVFQHGELVLSTVMFATAFVFVTVATLEVSMEVEWVNGE